MQYSLHDVFISYRRFEDKEKTNDLGTRLAGAIYRFLTKKGLRVFWDDPEMEPGDFEEQLHWQIEHSPNYIFIGTEAAKRFRSDVKDFVAEEVGLALKLYHASPNKDRVAIHVLPMMSDMDRDKAAEAGPYPDNIQKLMKLHGVELHGELPTDKDLSDILKHVTRVNRGNIWNAGHHWFEQSREAGHRFASLNINKSIMPNANIQRQEDVRLPIRAHGDGQADLPLLEMIEKTPGHLYLIGEGGIGKTTALYSIMEDVYGRDLPTGSMEQLRLNGQVPLFVELSRAPDTYGKLYEGGKSTFIHRAVYQQLRQDLSAKQVPGYAVRQLDEAFEIDPETAVNPIHDLFTQQSPAPEYLLLLDGLNEVSRVVIEHREEPEMKSAVVTMILQEIHQLMTECPNVRVILTSRSKEQTNWGDETTLLYLSGVNDDSVKDYLAKAHVSQARIESAMNNEKLRDVLRVPLFLTLYAALDGDEELLTQGEILHLFFHQKKKALYSTRIRIDQVDVDVDKAASAKQFRRLTATMQEFILDFILPEIAWRMEQNDMFHIYRIGDEDEVNLSSIIEHVLTDESDTAVCGRYAEAFEEYLSDSDTAQDTLAIAEDMIERLGGRMRRVVDSILNCAVMTLGILQKNGDEYGFIHHHIRDYFAAVYQINRLKLAVYLQKRKKNELARECLSDWKAVPLHAEVRRFIGEALGEAHNAPVCDDEGNWHYVVPEEPCERNMIKRGFNIYRGRFDGEDGYAVWNLFEILKQIRIDICGEDLCKLDLRECESNGYLLGKMGCAIKMSGSLVDERFFMPSAHIGAITRVGFDPNGKYISTLGKDDVLRIWDINSFHLIKRFEEVNNLLFDRNSKYVCIHRKDGSFGILDAKTLQPVKKLSMKGEGISGALFCPDGKGLMTVPYLFEEGIVRLWDFDSAESVVLQNHELKHFDFLVLSPDRRLLAVVENQNASIYEIASSTRVGMINMQERIEKIVFSPDMSFLIVQTESYVYLETWDYANMEMIDSIPVYIGHEQFDDGWWIERITYFEVAFNAQLHCFTVAFRTDTSEQYYDMRSFQGTSSRIISWSITPLQMINETLLEGEFRHMEYSPDGRCLLVAKSCETMLLNAKTLECLAKLPYSNYATYHDMDSLLIFLFQNNAIEIYDSRTMQKSGMIRSGYSFNSCRKPAMRRERMLILRPRWDKSNSSLNEVALYNMDTYQVEGVIRTIEYRTTNAVYTRNGRSIVYANMNSIMEWDSKTFRFSRQVKLDSTIKELQCSKDGNRIIVIVADGTIRLLNATSLLEEGRINTSSKWITSVVFSPDGKYISAGTTFPTKIMVWDANDYHEVFCQEIKWADSAMHTDTPLYSEDGEYIALPNHGKILDARTFRLITNTESHCLFPFGGGRLYTSAGWSGDGREFVISRGSSMMIYDAKTLQLQRELKKERDNIYGMFYTFSPDGRYFITSKDSSSIVWDSNTYEEIAVLEGMFAHYSPDGHFILTNDNDIKIWDTCTYQLKHIIHTIPGLNTTGVGLRHLHPDSRLSDEVKERLYEYGAIVDERG